MVLKYDDLETFCANLLDKNNGDRGIGFHTLKHEIAKKFGFSDYKMKNVLKALMEYNFIERDGMADRFKIIYMMGKKEIDREIDAELDNYAVKGQK